MPDSTPTHEDLFESEELAANIVDTLVDHGLVEQSRFDDAVASVKWELDAQSAMGRVILRVVPK